jgi:hypothetical protein
MLSGDVTFAVDKLASYISQIESADNAPLPVEPPSNRSEQDKELFARAPRAARERVVLLEDSMHAGAVASQDRPLDTDS